MLVNLKEILQIAEQKNIAVGSFNCPNIPSALGIIAAAEELNLPVIIQHAECHEYLVPIEVIAPVMITLAKAAKVPVCVHLDHGEHVDYIEKGLKLGFTGVMFDGSTLPYEENLAKTKEVVALAKKYHASVEAELGAMGKRESGLGDVSGDCDDTKIYTNPVKAAEFVRESAIDALACSFGTTHGIYLKAPILDFNIVKEVRKNTDGIPVVMHGGSGVSEANFHEAVLSGVRKINYFTYMDKAAGEGAKVFIANLDKAKPLFYSDVTLAAKEAIKENVKKAMSVFARIN